MLTHPASAGFLFCTQCPYMDSSSACKQPVCWRSKYDCSRISGLSLHRWHRTIRAMMGYSRASSLTIPRASRTWTLTGSAGAGSTCSPSVSLLCNRRSDSSSLLFRVKPQAYAISLSLRQPPARVCSRHHGATSPRRYVRSCWPVRRPRCWDDGVVPSLSPIHLSDRPCAGKPKWPNAHHGSVWCADTHRHAC